jgi:hypothetical protein
MKSKYQIFYSNLLFVMIAMSFFSCSTKYYEAGNIQNNKITADGKLEEWNLPLSYGSEDGKYQYSITNDLTNVYISIFASSQIGQKSVLRNGIDVYIDPKGKKNKNIKFHFPDRANDQYTLTGFNDIENGTYNLLDATGFFMGLNVDNLNNTGIEIVIPKYRIYGKDFKSKKQNINIGITLNESRGENSRNVLGSNGGREEMGNEMGRGGMRGGMGSGGMRGGMGGGGMRGGGMSRGSRGGMEGGYNRGNQAYTKQVINWNTFSMSIQ